MNEDVAKKPLGILIGEDTRLKYYDLKTRQIREITETKDEIGYVGAARDKIYFDGAFQEIWVLDKDDKVTRPREGMVNTIHEHEGQMIDAGTSGMIDTENNLKIINIETMHEKEFDFYNSLRTHNRTLYSLVQNFDDTHSIWRHKPDLSLDSVVRTYDFEHGNPCDFIMLDEDNIISTVNEQFLDLNDQKIEGTWTGGKIRSLDLLRTDGKTAEVVYVGEGMREVMYASVDLASKTAKVTPLIKEDVYRALKSLRVVYDPETHANILSHAID